MYVVYSHMLVYIYNCNIRFGTIFPRTIRLDGMQTSPSINNTRISQHRNICDACSLRQGYVAGSREVNITFRWENFHMLCHKRTTQLNQGRNPVLTRQESDRRAEIIGGRPGCKRTGTNRTQNMEGKRCAYVSPWNNDTANDARRSKNPP